MKKLVICTLALAFSLGVAAQNVARNISLAAETAKFGYANRSALSLIQAANLMSGIEVEALDVDVEIEGEPIVSLKESTMTLNRETLLADAREMAADDNTLLAMVETVAMTPSRDVVGGAKSFTRNIPANGSLKWTYTFYGGMEACAVASGDGDTDLVTKDDDYTDTMVCTWTPSYRRSYTVKILNRGDVYNRCEIYIN